MRIKINKNLTIGNSKPPLIVAEISGNHNGKKSLFLKHIKFAARNGADMVKIQTYEPDDLTLNSKEKKYRISSGIWKGKFLWDLYKKTHTPYSWHYHAFRLAQKLNIILFSSPFSKKGVDLLEKLKVPIYKIASFEITDYQLIDYIAQKRKPIILSTGMASDKEIKQAIKIIKKYHKNIIVLHCVSSYPTPEAEANVNTILKLKKNCKGLPIGISDHTNDINSSLASIPLGSVLIEKHFKISKNLKSLDSKFSITPDQLQELKNRSIKIYQSLGKTKSKITKSERLSLRLRRSIFAKKNIKKGERISKNNIISLRPKIGIDAKDYFKIIGKKSKNNIFKNQPIFYKHIK